MFEKADKSISISKVFSLILQNAKKSFFTKKKIISIGEIFS